MDYSPKKRGIWWKATLVTVAVIGMYHVFDHYLDAKVSDLLDVDYKKELQYENLGAECKTDTVNFSDLEKEVLKE
jgi:hypothetical protein